MQSKVKNFRFTEAMCSDLDRLSAIWKCTATEAITRALTQAVAVENFKIFLNGNPPVQDTTEPNPEKQTIQNNFSLDSESTTRRDSVQQPMLDCEPEQEPPVSAAAEPAPADKPKRLQVRIFLKGQKKPIKFFSSYNRSDLDQKANQWLTEQGYQNYKKSTGTSFRWEV